MENKTADEIINMIAEVLSESDGYFIERIANMVLSQTITYEGDSNFTVEN